MSLENVAPPVNSIRPGPNILMDISAVTAPAIVPHIPFVYVAICDAAPDTDIGDAIVAVRMNVTVPPVSERAVADVRPFPNTSISSPAPTVIDASCRTMSVTISGQSAA